MRLSEFIAANGERILRNWEELVKTQRPEAVLPRWVLRAPAAAILRTIAENIEVPPPEDRQAGVPAESASRPIQRMAAVHVDLRIESGFDLARIIAEYSALSTCILRLWRATEPQAFARGADEVIRLTEVIDQLVAQTVAVYEQRESMYRDRFLGMLGHDLRNPLNSISLGAASLTEVPGLTDRQRATIARILSSVRRLDRMVGDILDFARGRLGSPMPLFPAPTNLELLLREIADEVESANPGFAVELDVDGQIAGQWDADRLKQAISNLLLNAIQHGGARSVSLAARAEDDCVLIEVHNEGPPIPKESLGTIFDPLVYARNSDQNRTGLGLGLFIVSEIVSAHGGTISVTSSEQEGTTFLVRLPAHQSK